MDGFKEFQGKDLDAAIQDACAYYNARREKLEIEILQDAKSGIFGIVGARKAKIRARRAHLPDSVQSVLGELGGHEQAAARRPQADALSGRTEEQSSRSQKAPRRQPAEQGQQSQSGQPSARSRRQQAQPAARQQGADEEKPVPSRSREEQSQSRRRQPRPAAPQGDPGETEESQGYRPMEEADAPAVRQAAIEAVSLLLRPLVDGEPVLEASVADGCVSIAIQGLDDGAAILIGRDGSTLAAVQYLASRLISRRLEVSVRVSLDVGNYRQRQEDELREMARALSDKVLQTGKSLSTRPLSSYQRRIVHLFLKGIDGIQTRSTGEGGLKRVLIMRRKSGRRQPQPDKQ
ncbi:MAG: Jag N-terminal domain-containing protein [Desulfovibrionaceae bacterium]|nr:Jag N-terminal domain-containing protein [Desulfovibrionaceae bacterium]